MARVRARLDAAREATWPAEGLVGGSILLSPISATSTVKLAPFDERFQAAFSRSSRLASPLPVPVPVPVPVSLSPSGPLSLAFQPDRRGERVASNVHLSAVARWKRAAGTGTGTGTGTGRKETTGERMRKTRFSRDLR
jgi:hypothetical protein